jgi:hypothetical protein
MGRTRTDRPWHRPLSAESPDLPNYGKPVKAFGLKQGCSGDGTDDPTGHPRVLMLDVGWTIVTADGKPSSHYENTFAISPKAIILTATGDFAMKWSCRRRRLTEGLRAAQSSVRQPATIAASVHRSACQRRFAWRRTQIAPAEPS